VPQIFIDEHHLGGSDDLLRAENNGHLDWLLSGQKKEKAA
jgi:glutaredoxin-related protein